MLNTILLSTVLIAASQAGGASPAQPSVAAAVEFAGFNDAGDVRLVIEPAAIERLASEARATVRLAISPVEWLTLDVQRFEVVAPDARFIAASRDGQSPIAPPRIVCLRGEIAGEPLSHVFLALSRTDSTHGLGMITRRSGEQWHVGTDRSGPRAALTIRRGPGDVPDFDHFCSVIPLGQGAGDDGGLAGLPPNAAAGPRLLNIAVDADQRYWQLFNNNQAAIDYVAMVIAAVGDIYLRDLHMTAALRLVRLWPNGGEPFQATDIGGFRQYWEDNEDLDGLNLVHLFSGRRDTSYGGIAYLTNACTHAAFGISAFLLGGFPAPVSAPNLGNWDVVVVAHEMGHNLGAFHTHDLDPPVDTCAQGTDERGTIMSYCHTRPGGLLNIDMNMHARTQDEIAADNPNIPATCLWHDCNGNLINDIEDIVFGVSLDANGDDIPDECQDCNSNGILDPVEIAGGAPDVNANGVLDACEDDCNANGQPDRWECAQNPSIDENGNRIPDSCEPDCDGNGIADFADIAAGTYTDVDRNSRPDVCDDCNANGLPDWIDMGREFNVYIGQSSGTVVSPVREYHAASGVVVGTFGNGSVGGAYDVVFGGDRSAYVAAFGTNSIVRVNPDTAAVSAFVAAGAGGLVAPSSLAFGPDGHLYVASQGDSRILKFNGSTGAFISEFIAAGTGGLAQPWDVVFGAAPANDLFVLTNAQGVLRYNGLTGAFIGVFASPANLNQPRGMCFLPDGRLLVTNRGNGTIRAFSAAGVDLGVWNDEYDVNLPWGIVVGPNGHVFTPKVESPVRIIEYTIGGRYIRSFIRGDSDLTGPTSIAFRPISSADADGNRVLDECEDTCIADIAPAPTGDGNVDVNDLLAVITHWGACPPTPCIGDIAPPGPPRGDGVVNVNDLLAIISSWGPCE